MAYVVLELQEESGSLYVLPQVKETIEEARNTYHTVLAYAAISTVDIHSASILDSSGEVICHESYTHFEEPQPLEPEE